MTMRLLVPILFAMLAISIESDAQKPVFVPTHPELEGLFLTSMVQEWWIANELEISDSNLRKIKKCLVGVHEFRRAFDGG